MGFSKITDKNELAKIDKFEREYPEFGFCRDGIFSSQEHDENGRAVLGNSVSILFDAGHYDSVDITIELAKFYVKLRDGFNMRGMYGCIPGRVHFKNPEDGKFTYYVSADSKGCKFGWRNETLPYSDWESQYFTNVDDILQTIDTVEDKPVKIYKDTKVNYSRNL